MRKRPLASLLIVAFSVAVAPPSVAEPDVDLGYTRPDVAEQNGNIVYYDNAGSEHPLTTGGGFAQPALSPDGKSAAFIKIENPGQPGYGDTRSSLWLAEIVSANRKLLLAPSPSDEPIQNLAAMWHPLFSPDGRKIYVMAEAWVTAHAIHQIDVRTKKHRFVSEGELLAVIAYGKYRNWLIIRKRRYLPAPDYGTDHPVYVISANGKRQVMIAGSAEDDGQSSVSAWISKNGAFVQ